MKILCYGLNYHPEMVGVGKYTGELTEFLASKDNNIRVITTNKYFPEWKSEENSYKTERVNNCKVYRCPIYVPNKPNGIKRIIHLLSFCISSFPVLLAQSKWKPDIIVVIVPTIAIANLLISIKGLLFKSSKTWLHIQDLEIEAAQNLKIIKSSFIFKIINRLEKSIYQEFDRISTISEGMKRKILDKTNNKIEVFIFRNWLDLETVKEREQKDRKYLSFSKEYKIIEDDIILMYSGSLNKKQDVGLLINTIKRKSINKKLKWLLSIEGPSKAIIEKELQNQKNVIITGLKPYSQLDEWLSMADIHLLPQKVDVSDLVMPSKLIGILASGRPVVATALKNSELADVINGCGLISKPGEVDDFIIAIDRLVENQQMRISLGIRARVKASRLYDKEKIMEGFYRELTNIKG